MSISAIDLTGKVALVTGGSKGLGYAMAQGLAQFGADVSIASRNQQEIEQAAKELSQTTGRKAVGFTCDVSKKEQVNSLVENTGQRFG